jgi:uncharacterized protein (TIGR02284 family)
MSAKSLDVNPLAPTAFEPSVAAAEVVPVLNHLISICKDGQYGYRTAAADVKTPACKDLLAVYATQRAEMARELSGLVEELGLEPETEGSIAGRIHREWIDVTAALTGRRTLDAVLRECERGEATAVRAYQEATRRPLGARMGAVVKRHYEAIKAADANIRSLRELQRSD